MGFTTTEVFRGYAAEHGYKGRKLKKKIGYLKGRSRYVVDSLAGAFKSDGVDWTEIRNGREMNRVALYCIGYTGTRDAPAISGFFQQQDISIVQITLMQEDEIDNPLGLRKTYLSNKTSNRLAKDPPRRALIFDKDVKSGLSLASTVYSVSEIKDVEIIYTVVLWDRKGTANAIIDYEDSLPEMEEAASKRSDGATRIWLPDFITNETNLKGLYEICKGDGRLEKVAKGFYGDEDTVAMAHIRGLMKLEKQLGRLRRLNL